jgi:tRNA splicing ligase
MLKPLYFIGLLILVSSCRKLGSSPDDSIAPNFDFASNSYFTPKEINKYRGFVECSETPYWEGKPIKLQGYMIRININTTAKSFFLYEDYNLSSPNNSSIIIHYESKDSAIITKTLLDNKDKHCLMRTTCFTGEGYIEKCMKIVRFTITKPEDLEFK